MNKNLLFYLGALVIFGAGIWFTLQSGSQLSRPEAVVETTTTTSSTGGPATAQANDSESALTRIGSVLYENLRSPVAVLLLQIIVIISAARFVGTLFSKIGQPAVIGEMVAGILLGPSLLGAVSPSTMLFLFPDSSMGTLKMLSQFGVILFMFTVGMELNAQHLREKVHAAVVVSHGSIIVSFFLGVTLSLLIYTRLAPPNVSFTAFALFMGIAMSITAFPVLARIIEERGLSKTYLGITAIACAAVDDVTAWCLLAVVIAISNADGLVGAVATILLSVTFISLMIFVLRPRLSNIIRKEVKEGKHSKLLVAGVVVFVLVCASFTEIIGIHSLFGAFLAGVVMPSDLGFRAFLRQRIETFSAAALLPLFFAAIGLRTQINLLNDATSWLICGGIIMVAVAGKLGTGMVAARWTGLSWRDAFSIGALMNTRGLMELVILNIGYDLGILPGRIFAMMVIMALVTTSMTGPLLSLVKSKEKEATLLARAVGTAG